MEMMISHADTLRRLVHLLRYYNVLSSQKKITYNEEMYPGAPVNFKLGGKEIFII